MKRKFPVGAEVQLDGVHFRVWAPECDTVEVFFANNRSYLLDNERNGYFSGLLKNAKAGDLYTYRLNGEANFPDPASRSQPQGPNGPSQIIDPTSFAWSDQDWPGVTDITQVILYELHVGTFTLEGTWRSAQEKLPHLQELGITVIEMMPIAEFCGHFNWGYDGINLFAPTHAYGDPDDLRLFIDTAHAHGIAVILDVVYNHFGPDGNHLEKFSQKYFKQKKVEWGRAMNFDGPDCDHVRSFFITNALYWIREFHFDGMRFDACHAMIDESPKHILADMADAIRKEAGGRSVYLTAENEQQKIHYVFPTQEQGFGLDAVMNEDFHHTAVVRLTGHTEGYYHDYRGRPQEFISGAKYGFLYQGQWYSWQKQPRGTLSRGVAPCHLIQCLENHDQVANSQNSQRLITLCHPGAYRAMSAFFLLAPQIPFLFQGQEFGSTTPFHYFSEQTPPLNQAILKGRIEFLNQFLSFRDPHVHKHVMPPANKETFLISKLDWKINKPLLQLYKDLILLRKEDDVFRHLNDAICDGAVLSADAFLIHYQVGMKQRLLIFNFGIDLVIDPAPEPLLAPPINCKWSILWSSEHVKYAGLGQPRQAVFEKDMRIVGNSALILRPKEINHE